MTTRSTQITQTTQHTQHAQNLPRSHEVQCSRAGCSNWATHSSPGPWLLASEKRGSIKKLLRSLDSSRLKPGVIVPKNMSLVPPTARARLLPGYYHCARHASEYQACDLAAIYLLDDPDTRKQWLLDLAAASTLADISPKSRLSEVLDAVAPVALEANAPDDPAKYLMPLQRWILTCKTTQPQLALASTRASPVLVESWLNCYLRCVGSPSGHGPAALPAVEPGQLKPSAQGLRACVGSTVSLGLAALDTASAIKTVLECAKPIIAELRRLPLRLRLMSPNWRGDDLVLSEEELRRLYELHIAGQQRLGPIAAPAPDEDEEAAAQKPFTNTSLCIELIVACGIFDYYPWVQ